MEHSNLYYMMRAGLLQLPSLLTIIGCLVFTIVRWKRYPKVSRIVATSLTLLLLHTLFFAFVFAFVPDWVKPGAALTTQRLLIILSFMYHSSLAIVLATLLSGVFMQRKAPAEASAGPA